ncbi:hypothetical protein P3X46_009687 [Hevea brasiliensis]|uniref:Uncharacterized protein n=1 Tax=Hevea brasiliensis TaxID=3981 RepID=A0ABQ9MRI2_HEVBR|nr:hypothetical protein P3X46_009687 [Hevea brasiliensis]
MALKQPRTTVHRHFSHGPINGLSYAADPLRQSAYELYIRFSLKSSRLDLHFLRFFGRRLCCLGRLLAFLGCLQELGVNVSSSRQRSELGGTADCCLFMVLLVA